MDNNEIIERLIDNNPQAREMFNEFRNSGMTAQDFFYKKAKEMGADVQSILSKLS